MTTRLLKEGQIVNGTYEVERYLGEGAFSEVYRVNHRFLGRQAMKVFKSSGMTVEDVETLLEEAVLLSRIGHPNIIRVFDANTTDTKNQILGFFTMEYVAGGSLDQFWQSHSGRLVPVDTSVEIVRQACRGLAVAHVEKPPIIHRDIKPQNLLVGYDASGLRIRISDFGLAKRVNPLTQHASARGTRVFKAPETFIDYQSDSPAGDVWALGVTLYLLLTDRLPYLANGPDGTLEDERFARPLISPSHLNILVDKDLECIVLRSLALRAEDRYRTAQDFLLDLDHWRPGSQLGRLQTKPSAHSDDPKSALGPHASASEPMARKKAAKALQLARQASGLVEAADLMEEAMNECPGLREEYETQLRLWRRGVTM